MEFSALTDRAQSSADKQALVSRRGQSSATALLDALNALLIERKSINVAISDVAERSGLNTALVRYYFRGKTGMLIALLDRIVDVPITNLRNLVDSDVSATSKLKTHLTGLINSHYRYPYMNKLVELLINDKDETVSRHVYEGCVEPLLSAQKSILIQGMEAGEFRRVDPTMSYFTLTGACDYLFGASHVHRFSMGADSVSDEIRRRYIEHVHEFVMAALRPDHSRVLDGQGIWTGG